MQFPTGGIVRKPQGMNRCNSDTDGTVRMKEDKKGSGGLSFRVFFIPSTQRSETFMKTKQLNVKIIAFISMLGALSAVLMSINVPLPFAPTFLKFDISELPALFAGFFLGPISGGGVIAVKLLLKVLLQGTETAFVGELMNLIGSCAFVLPAALIYQHWHTKRGALAALSISTVLVSIVCIFLNAYVAFPMYSFLYGMPMEAIIEMGSTVNPLVHDSLTLMIYGVFPFNLVKHGITSLATYLVYKRCGNALRTIMRQDSASSTAQQGGKI